MKIKKKLTKGVAKSYKETKFINSFITDDGITLSLISQTRNEINIEIIHDQKNIKHDQVVK